MSYLTVNVENTWLDNLYGAVVLKIPKCFGAPTCFDPVVQNTVCNVEKKHGKLKSIGQKQCLEGGVLQNCVPANINSILIKFAKPILKAVSLREGNRSGRRPVELPVGSRFFDQPVKPVETPVKFSFLVSKRHLSTNRNIHIYFIINKTFYKNSVNKPHPLKKIVGFKRRLICCDH